MIYHASFISESTMHALAVQKDRVYVAPALAWLYGTLEDAEAFGYPPSKAESVGYARELAIAIPGLKEMHKRGVRVSSHPLSSCTVALLLTHILFFREGSPWR